MPGVTGPTWLRFTFGMTTTHVDIQVVSFWYSHVARRGHRIRRSGILVLRQLELGVLLGQRARGAVLWGCLGVGLRRSSPSERW